MCESPDDEVSNLLQSWGLADLKPKFKANYIVMEALEYLSEEDIIELIPKIGQRAIFRGRLKEWKQQKNTESEVPMKKIKLEQQCDEVPPQQAVEEHFPVKIDHKVYGTLIKISPVSNNTANNNHKPNTVKMNMQSKVQKFFIPPGSTIQSLPIPNGPPSPHSISPTPPPIISNPRTLTGPLSPSSSPLISNPRTITRKTSPSTPPILSNPRSIAFSPENNVDAKRRNIVQVVGSDSKTNKISKVRVIGAAKPLANIPNSKVPMVQIPHPTVLTPSHRQTNFNPDLTPFVTSIIRVETNCETAYPENGNPSLKNPITKVNRTTILQKIKPEDIPKPATKINMSPVVRLETEILDQNWNRYTEPEQISLPEVDLEADTGHDQDGENTDNLTEPVPSPETQSENESTQNQVKATSDDMMKVPESNIFQDIRKILMEDKDGQGIFEYYETYERLVPEKRNLLMSIIAEHCVNKKIPLTPLMCKPLADEIIKVFPNEQMDDYFVPHPLKQAKVPIYYKYRRLRRAYFKLNNIPMPTRKYTKPRKVKNNPKSAKKNDEDTSNNEEDDSIIIS